MWGSGLMNCAGKRRQCGKNQLGLGQEKRGKSDWWCWRLWEGQKRIRPVVVVVSVAEEESKIGVWNGGLEMVVGRHNLSVVVVVVMVVVVVLVVVGRMMVVVEERIFVFGFAWIHGGRRGI
ncbi:hypothetical protein Ancab_037733 [Ancistrocladus abbreviatus]